MHSIDRRRALQLGLATPLALASGGASSALAQGAWPTRQVNVLLPFGAGGAVDTVSRVLFAKVADRLKQPFVIENKTGGNTMVASSAAHQAPKDGHTFLANAAQVLINPVLMKNLPFDFATAFQPVSRLAAFPQVLAVRADFPAKDLAEFVAHAKANPGKVSWGTPPAAGMAHMAGAFLQSKLGFKLNHAPYRLATEAVRDVGGGQIDCVILTTSTIQPALQGNKVRILGVTSAKRVPTMPDVPTIAETVLPGFDMDDWFGIFAPAGVPADIVRQMQAALADAAKEPDVATRLGPLGIVLVVDGPEAFGKFLGEQRTVLTDLIKETGITLE
jgi:tripartite-type tricarboxylate transporter receptor subunit TctC